MVASGKSGQKRPIVRSQSQSGEVNLSVRRLRKFSSIWGESWVVGRYLLPYLKELGKHERGVVLDLACGESPFRPYFPNSAVFLRIDRYSEELDVTRGDMEDIPLQGKAVDTVILSQALADAPRPICVLREVARVLRAGGRVIVFESMTYPEHDLPDDYFRLMPRGLEFVANEAGLVVTREVRLGGLFTRFAQLWNIFLMGRLKSTAVLGPIGAFGVLLCNLVCYALDRMFPHGRLASDYLAVLEFQDSGLLGRRTRAGRVRDV